MKNDNAFNVLLNLSNKEEGMLLLDRELFIERIHKHPIYFIILTLNIRAFYHVR